jgi:hypothetical protein
MRQTRPAQPRLVRICLRAFLPSLAAGLLAALPAAAQPMTRSQAVAALLDPGSGVAIDLSTAGVYSPFVDFGSGPGFEGLLPAGSSLAPKSMEWGSGTVVPVPAASYFFWVDSELDALFAHPVRFILVNAAGAPPTVANGGIVVSPQDWWPRVTLAGGGSYEFFATGEQRLSPTPPGVANPIGYVAGPWTSSPGPAPKGEPGQPDSPQAPPQRFGAGNPCGLIVQGSAGIPFDQDVDLFESDLKGHYGVPTNRIVKASPRGTAATKANLTSAIATICAAQPPCDKIIVRMTSHGTKDTHEFVLADGPISNVELCNLFKELAKKGVPICLLINSCYSGSQLDAHNWNFPAGSVVLTAATSNKVAYGYIYLGTNGVRFTNSALPRAFSECLNANPTNNPGLDPGNDGVSDVDAFRWVQKVNPCYALSTATNIMRYPGSATNGPDPQIRTVGAGPRQINLNVRNATGAPKTDFHIVFQGNVTGGIPRAWRSDQNDNVQLSNPWGSNNTVTYDPAKNETMVCWEHPSSPVAPGQFIHFGYVPPAGGLRPVRQYWTPTTTPAALPDRTPTSKTSLTMSNNQALVRIISNSSLNDGWSGPVFGSAMIFFAQQELPLEQLNLPSLVFASDAVVFLSSANFLLLPDVPFEFSATLPGPTGPDSAIIVAMNLQWETNPNTTMLVQQFPLGAPIQAQPQLQITAEGGLLVITWEPPTGTLWTAPTVEGPWSPLPSLSPTIVNPRVGPPMQFFRVSSP